ncbi:MAG: T9SS type A sorting domain-containing protein [Bacteroidales bacterium]|nr:T9SS type A sorting domain-containing protein [Bacteroidales bacterium]
MKALLVRLFLLPAIFLVISSHCLGATRTASVTGNWNSTATWGGSAVPTASDAVIINPGVTVTVNTTAVCLSLAFTTNSGSAAQLSFSGTNSLTVTGTVTVTRPSSTSLTNTVAVNAGTLTCATLALAATTGTRYSYVTISTGTVNVSGNITAGGTSSQIIFSNSGIVNVGGTFMGSTVGTLTPGTGTICYNKAGAQTIANYTYYNLTIAGSGTKTESSATINGMFTVEGTATFSGTPNYGANASIRYNTATSRNSGVEWTSTFNGTGGVIIANAGAITMAGAKVVGAGIEISSGATLITNNNSLSIGGDLSNSGTFTTGTSTITFNGSTAQLIEGSSSTTFSNLTLSNSSGLTLSGSVNQTVTGILNLVSGIITTGSNVLILGNSASVSGADALCYINGYLRKGVAAGTTSMTFEVGDALYYSPITMSITGTTNSAGNLTARAVSGDHPNILSSDIDPSLSVNKYWTLTNSGVTGITSYDATFTYYINDIDPGADYTDYLAGLYSSSSWTYPFVGTTDATTVEVTGLTGFGDFQFGQSSAPPSACQYGDNGSTPSVADFVPCIDFPSNEQTVSASLAAHQYFTMNVIKGVTYEIYTCNSTPPSNPLALVVYQEGAPTDPYIAYSYSNSGNPCTSSSNNVYLSFTSGFSGKVRVLLNRKNFCSSSTPSGITVKVNASGGSNVLDSETAAGTDSWIGHLYDDTNAGVAYSGTFSPYVGYYTQAETFNETFGGGTNDVDCFNSVYSNGTIRASLKTITYAVRYRMNSTKRGLYIVDLGSDDGGRLAVDGALVYNNWNDQSYSSKPRVLMPLTGSSSLIYDFYENAGASRVTFQNLTLVLANTLSTNTSQSVCLGNSGSAISGDTYGSLPSGISLSGTGYQWTYSTSPGGSRTNISGATAATYTPNSSAAPFNVAGTYYIYRNAVLTSTNNVSPSTYTATLESNAATIIVASPPSATISYTGSPFCLSSSPVTVNLSGTSGGTFTASPTGLSINSSTGTITPASSSANTYTVTYTIAAAGGCALYTATTSVTINPTLAASVSIGASSTTICAGTSVTFTATPTNGGSTPSYQWKLNGSNVGTNSTTYTSSALANNDAVICIMTSNASCVTGSPATSNTVTMTVNSNVAASVSIGASSTTICSGSSVTFTATPTNGGSSPSYQWKLNGSNVGTSSTTYTNSSLANNDIVSCVMTSNASCVSGSPATSNSVTMTVNPNLPASVSIAASATTICSGTSVTFTATPTNGGSSPSYQWKLNGTNVGTNSTTYTNSSLANGNTVTCVMTSNATCATGSPATSNTVTMTVNPNLPVSVSIGASATTICSGTSVTFTATPTNGGTTPTYQWKVNGTNAGTNSSTFTTTTLANSNAVTCVLTSNASCATGSPATSNSISMTVNPNLPVSVSVAASSNPVCSGSSVTFTATPTNGGSTPTYQWKLNGSNVGTNSATYTNSSLANGNTVVCVLTSNATCATGSPATSNTVTMTVNPIVAASVSIAASSNPVCSATVVTFTATPTNGGSTPSYQWKVNGTSVGGNSTTYSTGSLSNNDVVSCIMTSNASCVTGSPATSNSVTMTVNANVAASVSVNASATSICSGSSVTFTATPTNGGTTPVYQWKLNGANVGTNSTTYSNSSLANGDIVTCVMTSNASCVSGSPATSNSVTMTVSPNLPVSVSVAASSNPACSGTSVTFTATPTNGGSTPSYQWKLNGSNVGTNSSSYSSSALNTNDAITCVLTSNAGCITGNPATSNTVTMTVNPILPVSVSIAASSNPVCSGTSVTFTATPVNGGSSPSYQWKLNGSNVGTNSATFSSSSLSNNDVVTCYLTSNASCSSGSPATSNSISMTVNQIVVASVSIAASSNPICSGSSVTFTATPTNGGSAPAYQWKLNGSNIGSNSATYTSSALTNNDIITCELTSNATCVSGSPATSNSVTMTVNPIVVASVSIAASSSTVCSGTSVTFTATPTNGGSSPVYQWKLNGTNVGSNSTTYTNAGLANNDVVSCTMTSNATCVSGSPATSGSITMTVNPNYAVSVAVASGSGTTICAGTSVTFTATPTNGGSSPVYQWIKNGSNVGSNSSSYTNAALLDGDIISCELTSNLTCTTGNPATSNSVSMTVNLVPTDPTAVSASPSSIYSGYAGQIVLTASGGGGGSSVVKWYEGSCGSATLVGTGTNLTINPPSATTVYYARWENGSCYSACVSTTVSVAYNYRSKTTGSWNLASSWEIYRAGSWVDASTAPISTDGTITIRNAHTITVPSSAGYINVDEITIDAGGKLVVNVCPSNWWFNIIDGPGDDITINGTMEYQDDKVSMASGATMVVGDGGKFQHNLNYVGNYPITAPTATWHANSTYEVLSSNQLTPSNGFNQNFGNFTWNYSGQTSDINLVGALSSIAGNLSILSTGTKSLILTNTTALTVTIGNDLIIQSGILDFASGAAATKVINLSGNYNQTGGTFKNTNSKVLTINFKGSGKTFTQSAGTLTSTYINWDINSGASLSLNNNLPVATSRSCTLNGTLDCGITTAVTGTGSFTTNSGATLILGSPAGITSTAGTGNVQTTTATFNSSTDFVYNGVAAQVSGNRLPSIIRNLTLDNSSGMDLSGSVTLNGQLLLTTGALGIGSNSLTLQNQDIPVVRSSGTITTTSGSNLAFGSSGNIGGAAFTIPDNLFTSAPALNNFTIYRTNSLTLGNQQFKINGTVLCNGPLNTNGKLQLLSTATQTALIDGTGSGNITGAVSMQRYIPQGFGYKYLSTPFQSTQVGDYSAYVDLNADFPTFYKYEENKTSSGWTSYTSPSSTLSVMNGYAINFGSSANTVTIELSGSVNNGTISPQPLYNHNQVFTKGFNLAGNPYPSPINWTAATGWTKTNIDNAIYYFNTGSTDQYTGTYSSYINGVSSDGIAGAVIPSMQGFFIHVTNGSYPVTASFGMDNRVRVNNLSPAFHKSLEENTYPMIRLTAAYVSQAYQDPAVIYFDENATLNFDPDWDALKLLNTDPQAPSLYINAGDNEKLSIAAIPEFRDSLGVVPLGLNTDLDGWVNLTATEIDLLPYTGRVYLVDSVTGVIQDLAENSSYRFLAAKGMEDHRFSLVFSLKDISHIPPTEDEFNVSYSEGKLYLFTDLAMGTKSTLVISNQLGQTLRKYQLSGSGYQNVEPGLPTGIYLVTLYTVKGTQTRKIFIQS